MLNELQRAFFHADPGKELFAKAINIEMRGRGDNISEKRGFSEGSNTFVRDCSFSNFFVILSLFKVGYSNS